MVHGVFFFLTLLLGAGFRFSKTRPRPELHAEPLGTLFEEPTLLTSTLVHWYIASVG